MTVEVVVADQIEIEAVRGVSYYEEFTLYENDGTAAAPVKGDALNLSDWPNILLMADVATDQTLVRGVAGYITLDPARISVLILYQEMDRAFDSANNSRPLHITVKAANSALTRERTLLNGTMRVRESGY